MNTIDNTFQEHVKLLERFFDAASREAGYYIGSTSIDEAQTALKEIVKYAHQLYGDLRHTVEDCGINAHHFRFPCLTCTNSRFNPNDDTGTDLRLCVLQDEECEDYLYADYGVCCASNGYKLWEWKGVQG